MKNSKLSVQELALQLTTKNLVKSRSSRTSINSHIVDIMKDGAEKTRIELVNEITLKRIEETEEINAKSFENPEFLEKFAKINKTVKNGVDTSMAQGKSGSNFINSEFAEEFELVKNSNGTYSLNKI